MRLRLGKLALVAPKRLDMRASLDRVLMHHDLEKDRLIRITKLLSLAIIIVTPTLRLTTAQIPICVLVVVNFRTATFRIVGINRHKWRKVLHRYPSCLSAVDLVQR